MSLNPKVSFVVPCYKLAHLLKECVDSILGQTYANLEVLIMDDQSPDDTQQVACSFSDPRVRYIHNEANLGHLRNYNKGIGLCTGDYIWLISADDRLSKDYVLARYVDLMESHPNIGYVFGAARFLEGGVETRLVKEALWGERDVIFDGKDFFERLFRGDADIACPTCMVRKECYDVSLFPLDMPHAGDRYLWALWALTYDVAYFTEPMVAYRLHDLNIMKSLKKSGLVTLDLLAWQRRMRLKAEESGHGSLARSWMLNISNLYSYNLLSERFGTSAHCMTFDEFEASLPGNVSSPKELKQVRARVYASFADGCYRHGEYADTLEYYKRAFAENFWMPRVWGKYLLLRTGKLGLSVRRLLSSLRPQDAVQSRSAAS